MTEAERVVGVVGGMRLKTGMFSSKSYSLVFTDRRLLLAELTGVVQKAHAEQARAAAKAAGGGFMRQFGAQLFGPSPYLSMHPGAVLAETPGNFFIEPQQVSRFKVSVEGAGDEDGATVKVQIEGTGPKLELTSSSPSASVSEIKNLARGLLGDRAG